MSTKKRRAMYRFEGARLLMVDLGGDDRELIFDATGIPFSGRAAFAEAVAQAYEVGYSRGAKNGEPSDDVSATPEEEVS